MWVWTQAKPTPHPYHCLWRLLGRESGVGAEEIPFYLEKIVVFDYPIIPSYKAGTTMDFP